VVGHLLHIKVHGANIHDTIAACDIFNYVSEKYPSIKAYSADAGYCGTAADHVDNELQLKLHISKRIKDEFAILPKRWIVERTFAWLGNFRRLAKDFEILTERAENFVRIAMMKITLGAIVNV
jgi:putative transposase